MPLDPVVVGYLASLKAFAARPPSVDDIPSLRAQIDAMMGGADKTTLGSVTVEDRVIEEIPVRLYRPAGTGPFPLHVYFHGGAFMLGSALSGNDDQMLATRAQAAGCIVASVEYRLAPEHRFPAGVEDCYQALLGLVNSADELGVDPARVTVGGASSGGNFAAVVALMCAERGGPALLLQLLEIAGTDLTKTSHAWRNPAEGHDTTREADLTLIDMYLNNLPERAHPHASPLFAPDLSGVAPAYVMNAEFDPRRDECEAYVARLQDAGVTATARTFEGHVHGSMGIPDWEPAITWQAEANHILALANSNVLTLDAA
jgi:acetyl esterase/lipase